MNPKYKQIGDFYFDLNKPIGQGAFATVFRAVDRKNRREAAVKVLPCGELLQNQDLQSFFMRELSVLHRIAGEHVVQLLDVKRTSNNLYLFTEFCDGGNLEDKLKAHTYFSEEDACSIVKQIADAFVSLEDLHMMNTQGKRVTVMHRDIKPANILFHQDKVKMADFGFAKFIEHDDKNTQQTNTLLGTPLYMAPQVLNHEKFSTKCDVWSMGVVLYRILFGALPWTGYSVDSLYANIRTQPLTFPKKISEDTKDLLTRMLKIREEDRLSWTEVHGHPALNKKKSWEI